MGRQADASTSVTAWLIVIDENWLKENPIVCTDQRLEQVSRGIPVPVMNVCEDSEDLEGKDQRKYQRGRCDWNWSNSQVIIRN